MEKLKDLSIADLKAAADYVEKLKSGRLDDIKYLEIDSKDDNAYKTLDKFEFELNTHLFSRLMKLKNS